MSLAHNGHSQLADSNTGEATGIWLHGGGLSPLGKQVIAEMNKWGIMVDVSHPSKAANLQAIALSKAPVIASHSSARALADHSRNLDDETLWAMKQNGGVVQTVAFASYVTCAATGTAGGDRGARSGVRDCGRRVVADAEAAGGAAAVAEGWRPVHGRTRLQPAGRGERGRAVPRCRVPV